MLEVEGFSENAQISPKESQFNAPDVVKVYNSTKHSIWHLIVNLSSSANFTKFFYQSSSSLTLFLQASDTTDFMGRWEDRLHAKPGMHQTYETSYTQYMSNFGS